ncbi:uncharacterized protein LOC142342028 [Convolutriloba macropyga]|uniref:uncharacterized protein LOC142342028 n=1 Tax=Convolutriloba macropyga TaxID=536237 RepID=UPI003F527215
MAEKPNHNSQICDLTNNDFPDQQNSDSDKIPTTADNSSEVDMVQKELKRGNIKILCRGRLHTSRSTDSEGESGKSSKSVSSSSSNLRTGARFHNRDSIKVTRKRFTHSAHCSYDSPSDTIPGGPDYSPQSYSAAHSQSQSPKMSGVGIGEGGGRMNFRGVGRPTKLKSMSDDSVMESLLCQKTADSCVLIEQNQEATLVQKPFDPQKEPKKSILKKKSDLKEDAEKIVTELRKNEQSEQQGSRDNISLSVEENSDVITGTDENEA